MWDVDHDEEDMVYGKQLLAMTRAVSTYGRLSHLVFYFRWSCILELHLVVSWTSTHLHQNLWI